MGNIKIFIYLFLNVFFSIIIILLNKWIYLHVHFPNVTLSFLHFLVTFLGLCICERINLFNIKSVHIGDILILALSFCGFVVFTNLSLQNNSIGTFQVVKILTTPGVMLIQMLYYGKQFSGKVKLSLIPIIAGVYINFYYDIHFNLIGSIYALLGVVITSLYQVLVNSKQSELNLNSMQLLYYQAPLSAAFLCVCIPILEPPLETLSHNWTFLDLIMIMISCLAALFCNITTYWIIGNTSPLTYNMLGHSKFVLITFGGWMIFKETITLNQCVGITLTLLGIILYTQIKIKENVKTSLLLTSGSELKS